MDKAQRQHLESVRAEATEERQRELGRSADQALHALAPIYSLLILQYSTYKQVSPCADHSLHSFFLVYTLFVWTCGLSCIAPATALLCRP